MTGDATDAAMRDISADPDVGAATTDSLSSDTNSEQDRSDDVIETPAAGVSGVATPPVTGKSRRYPSFRDLFIRSLRSRKVSDAEAECATPAPPDAGVAASVKTKGKRKDKSAGCAGWLEKRHRRKSSASSDDGDGDDADSGAECPALVPMAPHLLQCSRCQDLDTRGPCSMTYTKRQPPADECVTDANWLCSRCLLVLTDADDAGDAACRPARVAPLSHLAMDVVKTDVSFALDCSTNAGGATDAGRRHCQGQRTAERGQCRPFSRPGTRLFRKRHLELFRFVSFRFVSFYFVLFRLFVPPLVLLFLLLAPLLLRSPFV